MDRAAVLNRYLGGNPGPSAVEQLIQAFDYRWPVDAQAVGSELTRLSQTLGDRRGVRVVQDLADLPVDRLRLDHGPRMVSFEDGPTLGAELTHPVRFPPGLFFGVQQSWSRGPDASFQTIIPRGRDNARAMTRLGAPNRQHSGYDLTATVTCRTWQATEERILDEKNIPGCDLLLAAWLTAHIEDAMPRVYLSLLNAFCAGAWCLWFDRTEWLVALRPTVEFDALQRLNSTSGLAYQFLGDGLYFLEGVSVPQRFVTAPDTLMPDDVTKERNAEVRRIALKLVGYEKFLTATQATRGHQDEFGQLWHLPALPGEREELLLLEVVNASAEGSWVEVRNVDSGGADVIAPQRAFVPVLDESGQRIFKHYVLRIDPRAYGGATSKHPQAAAASTWRYPNSGALVFVDYRDYVPRRQS